MSTRRICKRQKRFQCKRVGGNKITNKVGTGIINNTNIRQFVELYVWKNDTLTIKNPLPPELVGHSISDWDVSGVTIMKGLFERMFITESLNEWDVSNVTDMSYMFHNSNYNKPLDKWDVSSVTTMESMFKRSRFNHPINIWEVSKVENMNSMFEMCNYNRPLNNWDVQNVKYMINMFSDSEYFNHTLNDWNVSTVSDMTGMFKGSEYNQPLNEWRVSSVKYMTEMFAFSKFNHPLDKWDVSNVESMNSMFKHSKFSHSLDAWKITSITSITNAEDMFMDSRLTHLPRWYLRLSAHNYTYKTLTHDSMYDRFDQVMSQFETNPKQIDGVQLFITDQILHNVRNPYVVHYETTTNGAIYPIITILKGTMLFTGRSLPGNNLVDSYYHLYKLHNKPTLHDYATHNFEHALTYFFPFPYLSNIISTNHTTLDMVVLTKDIRLLCLISPSPLERGYKDVNNQNMYNDFEQNQNMISTCDSRKYDLCMNNQLIMELKLNGYIGIAHEDSISSHLPRTRLQTILSELPQINNALFQACCFNNAIYENNTMVSNPPSFKHDVDTKRTFGIPEIVLIPYDIHTYPDPQEYIHVQSVFQNGPNIDHSHFIFRNEYQAQGKNSIDTAKQMEQVLVSRYPMGTVIGKSLQAPTLLTVLLSEVDTHHRDYIKYDAVCRVPNELFFPNSYLDIPTSKCAFELMPFYYLLTTVNMAGGKRTQSPNRRTRSLHRRLPKETQIVRTKKLVNSRSTQFLTEHNTKRSKKVSVNTPTLFYTEVSGMPVVATM
jgi:hypothetical protein